MKITELRCPACGGPLTVNEKDPRIAKCEYCEASIALEWEDNRPYFRQEYQYKPPTGMNTRSGYGEKTIGRGQTKIAFGAVVLCILLALPLVFFGMQSADTEPVLPESPAPEKAEEPQSLPLSGNLGELASEIFGLPVQEISERNLARIQWLEVKYADDQRLIGYSFDATETEGAQLTWVEFSRDSDLGQECLSLFTGLKRISVNSTLRQEDLKGLKLESMEGYFDNPQEVAAILEKPSSLRELQFMGGVEDLEGLEEFSGLESLSIGSSELTEVDALLNLPNLKRLELRGFDDLSDFSVFSTMDGLVELSLDSENVRALNFLGGMTGLKRLEVKNGQMLSLDGLEERPELESLIVDSCDTLQNMDAVTRLSGLKELSLDLPYDCSEPALGGLTNLEHLTLSGFKNGSFLGRLNRLQSLELDGCYFPQPPNLSGLKDLKELSYYSFAGTGLDVSFIKNLPALEKLNMSGISTYDDISGIFNMKTLKELNISGMECEIDFDRIAENGTLERLSMNNIMLYENVQVSGGGGIVYVEWDDVVLDEHTAFLGRLTGLKHLSVRENTLTDISFVTTMAMLETVDLTDNYITELRPLAQLQNLRQVICTGNPIANKNVLGDGVELIL